MPSGSADYSGPYRGQRIIEAGSDRESGQRISRGRQIEIAEISKAAGSTQLAGEPADAGIRCDGPSSPLLQAVFTSSPRLNHRWDKVPRRHARQVVAHCVAQGHADAIHTPLRNARTQRNGGDIGSVTIRVGGDRVGRICIVLPEGLAPNEVE